MNADNRPPNFSGSRSTARLLERLTINIVGLHGAANKSRPHRKLLQTTRPDIRTSGTDAAEDGLNRVFNGAAGRDKDGLSLCCAIFSNAARVLIHCVFAAHSVKPLIRFAVDFD